MIQASEAPKRRNIRHTGQGEAEAHASPTDGARSVRHGPAGIEQCGHEKIGAEHRKNKLGSGSMSGYGALCQPLRASRRGSVILGPVAHSVLGFVLGMDSGFHAEIVAHPPRMSRDPGLQVALVPVFMHQRPPARPRTQLPAAAGAAGSRVLICAVYARLRSRRRSQTSGGITPTSSKPIPHLLVPIENAAAALLIFPASGPSSRPSRFNLLAAAATLLT